MSEHETISTATLRVIEASVESMRAGVVSDPIDLSDIDPAQEQ